MKKLKYLLTLSLLLSSFQIAFALEVDREVFPKVVVEGRIKAVVQSENQTSGSTTTTSTGMNVLESVLSLGFSKKLFRNGTAGGELTFAVGGSEGKEELELEQGFTYLYSQNFRH